MSVGDTGSDLVLYALSIKHVIKELGACASTMSQPFMLIILFMLTRIGKVEAVRLVHWWFWNNCTN